MADPWEAFEVAVDPEGLSWFELGRYDLVELGRGTYGAVSQFVTARNVVNAREVRYVHQSHIWDRHIYNRNIAVPRHFTGPTETPPLILSLFKIPSSHCSSATWWSWEM